MKYQHTVVVDKPLKDVFRFVANGENNPRWRSAYVESKRDPASPHGTGSVVRQYARGPGGGASFPADYVITEYVENRKIGFRTIAGPAKPEGRFTFAPEGRRTVITVELWWQPKGVLEQFFVAPMVSRLITKDISALNNLRWTPTNHHDDDDETPHHR